MKLLKKAAVLFMALFILAGVCPQKAEAIDQVTYNKVLIETYTSAKATGNTLPVVGQKVSDIVIKTNTTGLAVTGWELVGAGTKVENRDYVLNVNVSLWVENGVFDFFGTKGYINGVESTVTVNSDLKTATISRLISPDIQAAVVWHHPGNESHDAGECFSFTATASQVYDSYQWKLRSPYNETYNAEDVGSIFPGPYAVIADIENGTRCNIYDVPEELNGWSIYCIFKGAGGDVPTNSASITVKNAAPEPTIQIVAAPDAITVVEEKTQEETDVPQGITIVDAPEEVDPEENENITIVQWEEAWTYDDNSHWHKSADSYSDETSEPETHTMSWTTTREATKKADGEEEGVCEVCGYTTRRNVPYVKEEKTGGMSKGLKIGLGAVGAVAVIGGGVMFTQYEIDKKKRKRRAKMAGRKKY